MRWMDRSVWPVLLLAVVLAGPLVAQDYGARLGTVQRGGRVSFEPSGPGVLFDALDPAIRKWYVPQELYAEYQWRQWEYANYAREPYQRYVSASLAGDFHYDMYGNLLTRGWLLYDWRQVNPQSFGSSLTTSGHFASWFNSVVVASDHKGQYHYAITIGKEIRTTLTPMTFSKPLFNGMQWDFASDKHLFTLLLSRVSNPLSSDRTPTDNTNLLGGRMVIQLGDFVRLGGTLVNAHHAYTKAEAFTENLLTGNLLGVQNTASPTVIEVLIRDDSPEDGVGGGALFASDMIIRDLDGNETRASEIGFRAAIEGGLQRRGFLAADGNEVIRLRFDLSDQTYAGPDPGRIERVELELVVANDYRIELGSDLQLDVNDKTVYLPIAQAPGNVRDGSNQRVLTFEYGLPTANQIAGLTLELTDLAGLEGYFELNVNHRYRQYPNPLLRQHRTVNSQAQAWLLNVSKVAYPYFAYFEAFDVSPQYTTSMIVVGETGRIDYGNDLQRYEFVDDNDDQDRRPDWRREGWNLGDDEVFPGWDENNDFISDFNQNDSEISPNRIPDYEEPFLRLYADRPEFLYGVDMNHNGWIDRFENDEEADLPYRRDRQGYNAYAGAYVTPDLRVTLGHLRSAQISDDRRNRATYLLLTGDRELHRWGRLRLYQDVRRVRDTIRDDLLQWLQPPDTRGDLYPVADVLPAENTWISTTWVGWNSAPVPGLQLTNKLKWQRYGQLDDRRHLALRQIRRTAGFFGLINKAAFQVQWGNVALVPAWKSEYRRQTPVPAQDPMRRELSELLMLLVRFPLLRRSHLEMGLEYQIFSQLRDPPPSGSEPSYRERVAAVQLTNLTDYLGYRLTTTLGFEVGRRGYEATEDHTHTRGFMTVYAGVE